MRKRILHISLLLLLLAEHRSVNAQNPTLSINSSNIGSEVSTELMTFTSSCIADLGLIGSGQVDISGSANLSSSASPWLPAIPLSKVGTQVTGIGNGGINLALGTLLTPEKFLSTASQSILTTQTLVSIGVLSSGNLTIKYRIPQSEMTNYAWEAGNYATTLSYAVTRKNVLNVQVCSFTTTRTLTVSVAPFIAISSIPSNIALHVNSFNYYRNSTISQSHTFPVLSTVKPMVRIKTNAANFAYTPSAHNAGTTLNPATAAVKVTPSGLGGSALTPYLSSSYQSISSTYLGIPAGNIKSITNDFSIAPATLKSNFKHAGNYLATMAYEVSDSTGSASSQNTSATLEVQVDEMYEISVNSNAVNLSFNNVSKYQTGTDTSVLNHLTVSATIPYDVNVKSSSSQLTDIGGHTIAANIITVGPGTAQTGVSSVNLSSSLQTLVSNSTPEIDRNISVRYGISAANAAQLLGKPSGDYSTTITYTIVPN